MRGECRRTLPGARAGYQGRSGGGRRVWRTRHRLQRLETELAAGRAERAQLRRRLDWFETIAAAAGAPPPGAEPAEPMPVSLVAAAREPRAQDVAVRLEVAGTEVIAVIGGAGDPHEWWSAIRHIANATDPEEAQA
jgi:hypothetical protein